MDPAIRHVPPAAQAPVQAAAAQNLKVTQQAARTDNLADSRVLNEGAPLMESGNPIQDMIRMLGQRPDGFQIQATDIKDLKVEMHRLPDGRHDVGTFLAPPDNKVCLKAVMKFVATVEVPGGNGRTVQVELLATRYTSIPQYSDEAEEDAAIRDPGGKVTDAGRRELNIANMTRLVRAMESDARGFESVFKEGPGVDANMRATNINHFIQVGSVISTVRTQELPSGETQVTHQFVNLTLTLPKDSTAYAVSKVADREFSYLTIKKAEGEAVEGERLNITSVNPQWSPITNEITATARAIVDRLPLAAASGYPQDIEDGIRDRTNRYNAAVAELFPDWGPASNDRLNTAAAAANELHTLSSDPVVRDFLALQKEGAEPGPILARLAALPDLAVAKKVDSYLTARQQVKENFGSPEWKEYQRVSAESAGDDPISKRVRGSLPEPHQNALAVLAEHKDAISAGETILKTPPTDLPLFDADRGQTVRGLIGSLVQRRFQEEAAIAQICNDTPLVAPGSLDTMQNAQSGREWVDAYRAHDGTSPGGPLWLLAPAYLGGEGSLEPLNELRTNLQRQALAVQPAGNADETQRMQAMWNHPDLRAYWDRRILERVDQTMSPAMTPVGQMVQRHLGSEAVLVDSDFLVQTLTQALGDLRTVAGNKDRERAYAEVFNGPLIPKREPMNALRALSLGIVEPMAQYLARQELGPYARSTDVDLLADFMMVAGKADLLALRTGMGLPLLNFKFEPSA